MHSGGFTLSGLDEEYFDAPFAKQTFISTIKIYDENNDCIAIAKLARPIKKLEERGYTFKLNMDI